MSGLLDPDGGSFMLGLERLLEDPVYFSLLRGQRLGLITNPTGVDRKLRHGIHLLRANEELGDYQLTTLFAPEHGLLGGAQATEAQAHGTDPVTGLPVWSLYGETTAPTKEMLSDVDVLIFDLQDMGVRFYTFIWTMYRAMEVAARLGKQFVVLDRPNPLGPRTDGPVLDPRLASFVGIREIPLQHGMTTGELALLFNGEFLDPPVEVLHVVPMANHDPWQFTGGFGLPWVLPSPNLPTRLSAWAHAGTGILDGTTASFGVGTTLPFEWMGHSAIDERLAHELTGTLNGLVLPGVIFRPMFARPNAGPQAGALCGGVQLHITDPERYVPLLTGLHLLGALLQVPEIDWKSDSDLHSGSIDPDVIWADRLFGDRSVRDRLDTGDHPRDIRNSWRTSLQEFLITARPYLLYGR